MSFLQAASEFVQGYFWATILFPVEYYLLKPTALKLWADYVALKTKYMGSLFPSKDKLIFAEDAVKNAI